MKDRMQKATSLAVAAWLLFMLLGVAAVFWTLWWKRDRPLYLGKTVAEQRVTVQERAGLDPAGGRLAERADASWPAGVPYALEGDANQASYAAYILAPRVPAGGTRELFVPPHPVMVTEATASAVDRAPGWPEGLLGTVLTVLVLAGIGFVFHKVAGIGGMSIPEKMAIGSLVLAVLVTLSRGVSGSAVWGFGASVLVGLMGVALRGHQAMRCCATGEEPPEARTAGSGHRAWGRVLEWGGSGIVVLAAAVAFAMAVIVVPDDWDAWAIWGPKAKVLAIGHGPLSDVTWFIPQDYPLLWPSVWGLSSWLSGGWRGMWEEQWARGLSPMFLLLAAWQMGVVVTRLGSSRRTAVLAAALFASIPKVIVVASWSYAEAALWLMYVCAFGRMLQAASSGQVRDVLLAGLFAAAAAWTKNEGVLFAGLCLVWLVCCSGHRRWRNAAVFGAPLLILYGPWWVWARVSMKLGSHATEGVGLSGERLRAVLERLRPALEQAGRVWMDLQQWGVALALIAVGVGAVLLFGRRRTSLAVPLVMLAVLFAIELFHTTDVVWLVGASWDRLTIQVLPLLLLGLAHGSASAGDGRMTPCETRGCDDA